MNETSGLTVGKMLLAGLVLSIGICAFLGIGVILSGRFGWLEFRVLMTTFTLAGASVCGLACGVYLSTGRGQILPIVGIGLTLVSVAMIVIGMWVEVDSGAYWKTAASCSVFAVACAHLSLLSMARLAGWFQWSLHVATFTIFLVATLIVLTILGETRDAAMFQLLGVAAIFDTAITILIPVFQRLSRAEFAIPTVDNNGSLSDQQRGEMEEEMARLQHRMAELQRMKDDLA